MENVKKAFEYIRKHYAEDNSEDIEKRITYYSENICNKLLSLPKGKEELYLNTIKNTVLYSTQNAIINYSLDNAYSIGFFVKLLYRGLFLEWIKPTLERIRNITTIIEGNDIYNLIDIGEFYKWADENEMEYIADMKDEYNNADYCKECYMRIDTYRGEEDTKYYLYEKFIWKYYSNLSLHISFIYPEFQLKKEDYVFLRVNTQEEEPVINKTPQPTKKEKLIALEYILNELGINPNTQDKTKTIEFIQYLTGLEWGKKPKDTDMYKTMWQDHSEKSTYTRYADNIAQRFEEVGLLELAKKVKNSKI